MPSTRETGIEFVPCDAPTWRPLRTLASWLRRPQFTLRFMLGLMTVLCVAMSWYRIQHPLQEPKKPSIRVEKRALVRPALPVSRSIIIYVRYANGDSEVFEDCGPVGKLTSYVVNSSNRRNPGLTTKHYYADIEKRYYGGAGESRRIPQKAVASYARLLEFVRSQVDLDAMPWREVSPESPPAFASDFGPTQTGRYEILLEKDWEPSYEYTRKD